MRSDPGVVKQGPFHALTSLVGSILANLNIVAACFLAALFLSLLSWGFLLGSVAADREEGMRDSLTQAPTMARAYSEQVARAINSHDLVLRQVRYGWQLSQQTLALDSPQCGRDVSPGAVLQPGDHRQARRRWSPRRRPGACGRTRRRRAYFRVHAGSALDRLVVSRVDDGAGRVRRCSSRARSATPTAASTASC